MCQMNLNTLTSRVEEMLFPGLAALFGNNSDSSTDRRAYTRVKTRFEGSVDLDGQRVPVHGMDLHRAGAGIMADAQLPVGSLVFFYERTHGLMGWASVRWCSWRGGSKYFAGLEFRSPLMRAEVGNWQFSYVQAAGDAAGIPV